MRPFLLANARKHLGHGACSLGVTGTARAQRGNAPKVADAKHGEVRLIATSAIRGPIEAIRAEAEHAIGHPLLIEFGSARGNLRDEILGSSLRSGLPDVLDDAAAQGKIIPQSRFDVAQVDVAIGQRGAAPKVDISTLDALETAMLEAKSVKWAAAGAALPGTNNILDSLKLRDAIKDRSNLRGEVPL
jgi:molybdate transport system substrate-binding protein